ncbi:DUF3617 domain-containing protein [Xanthobacter sp.]|uniref:DUF3617 domain-containing protein n=1 Tax=Xanthobacter sp. TaxID=35809 RepID=UPI0035B0602D
MNMRTIFLSIIALIAISQIDASISSAMAVERLQPGLWESTVTRSPMPAQTSRQCISTQAAMSVNGDHGQIKAAIDTENAKNGCVTKSVEIDGPRIRFAMTCSGAETISDLTYSGTASEGTMTTKMPGGKAMTMEVRSIRISDCP